MAAAKSAAIELPPLNIQSMMLKLVGDSPLIVHKWSEKARAAMRDKHAKKARTGRPVRDTWVEFCDSLYWISDKPEEPAEADVEAGVFGFPAIGFKAAAVTACTSTGVVTKVAARQAFHVTGELVRIDGQLSMREDVVTVGMGSDLRYRGEFASWSVVLPIRFNANVMSAEQIISLFQLAGFAVGVGEWRSERDGGNGLWHVASQEENQ